MILLDGLTHANKRETERNASGIHGVQRKRKIKSRGNKKLGLIDEVRLD